MYVSGDCFDIVVWIWWAHVPVLWRSPILKPYIVMPPPPVMKAILFAAASTVVALMVLGGAMQVEAHYSNNAYYNIIADILEYEVTEYTDFDLVRMKVSIENLGHVMSVPHFRLGSDISGTTTLRMRMCAGKVGMSRSATASQRVGLAL